MSLEGKTRILDIYLLLSVRVELELSRLSVTNDYQRPLLVTNQFFTRTSSYFDISCLKKTSS